MRAKRNERAGFSSKEDASIFACHSIPPPPSASPPILRKGGDASWERYALQQLLHHIIHAQTFGFRFVTQQHTMAQHIRGKRLDIFG